MNRDTLILLDVDGILADFVGAALKLTGKENIVVNRWDFHEQLGLTAKELWDTIDEAGHGFWADMPKYKWADDVVNMLEMFDVLEKTILCTSPSLSYSCNSGKVEWIHQNFSVFDRRFMITPCKHLLKGDFLLIDDLDSNCIKFAANNQPVILFPQLWNSNRVFCQDRLNFLYRRLTSSLRRR